MECLVQDRIVAGHMQKIGVETQAARTILTTVGVGFASQKHGNYLKIFGRTWELLISLVLL